MDTKTIRRLLAMVILTAGVCLAAGTQIDLTNQVRGILGVTNGGRGLNAVAVHQVDVGTASNTFTAKTIPDCQDSAGNHLNFTQSGDSFSCGTSTPASADIYDVLKVPAANCNNATAGNGWSIGSGGTVTCRAGTNNFGGYISITDTSSTFATFQIPIPEDWDTGVRPYIRLHISSSDATNGHTVIPSIQVACYKGDGSTTDDVAANAAHSLSTVTLNGNANRFWSTSNVQMNSTDMTNCIAGALMQITVGRATDTATDGKFWYAEITIPRQNTAQAN